MANAMLVLMKWMIPILGSKFVTRDIYFLSLMVFTTLFVMVSTTEISSVVKLVGIGAGLGVEV